MRDRGLLAFDEGTLVTALDALDAEHKGSDGDGIDDIQELKVGADPNSGGDGGADVASFRPASYGCEARLSPAAPVTNEFAPLLIDCRVVDGDATRTTDTQELLRKYVARDHPSVSCDGGSHTTRRRLFRSVDRT